VASRLGLAAGMGLAPTVLASLLARLVLIST